MQILLWLAIISFAVLCLSFVTPRLSWRLDARAHMITANAMHQVAELWNRSSPLYQPEN